MRPFWSCRGIRKLKFIKKERPLDSNLKLQKFTLNNIYYNHNGEKLELNLQLQILEKGGFIKIKNVHQVCSL